MVKIRLTRTGKRHEPHYRIVAVDSRRPRDGKYIEKIGYYNPRTKPPTLEYDKELLKKWIDNGAQMTDTVHDMFVKEGIIKQSGKRTARLELIMKPEEKEKEKESDKEDEQETPPKKEKSKKAEEKDEKEEEKDEKDSATPKKTEKEKEQEEDESDKPEKEKGAEKGS